jgi:sialidase-1
VEFGFNPSSQAVTLKVDGVAIATWNGQSSTSSLVSFGNNDTAIDGRMHITNIELVKNGTLAFKFDAAALTVLNPAVNQTTPESQGWTKTTQGSGFTQYGDSSINPGPGHGISLAKQTFNQGEHNGRLIYPAIQLDKSFLNVVSIYSDDHGQQWQYGDELPLPYQWSGTTLKTLEPSEADLVELTDGRLLMTVRLDFNQIVNGVNYGPRYQFVSHNGANVFPSLSTGTVDASITRIEQTDGSSYLAFTNPIGDLSTHAGRTNLGLWLSLDEGQTWKGPLQLVNGGSAYSDIIQINDSQVLIIFEDNTSQIRTMRLPIHLLRQLL